MRTVRMYFNPEYNAGDLFTVAGRHGWYLIKPNRCKRLIELGMFVQVFENVYEYQGRE
jgi:hypothetical protein